MVNLNPIAELRKNVPKEIMDMAADIHGHMSPGLTAGIKMVLYGLEQIEITPKDKVFIVSESVRCLQDACFTVSHYLINKFGWRVYSRSFDVGKFSIQILKNYDKHIHEKPHKEEKSKLHEKNKPDLEEKLFRVILNENVVKQHKYYSNWLYQQEKEKQPLDLLIKEINTPKDEEVFQIKPFSATMTEYCHLSNKHLIRCPECGEMTEKITMLDVAGKTICRVCGFFEK